MPDGEILVGNNMVVNLGRQTNAYLLGGRDFNSVTPNKDWIVTKASFGLYDEAPRFTDSTISPQPQLGVYVGGENEIVYDGTNKKKIISSVDWPQPFMVRFEILLGSDEANGYTIREMALWTDNETLFARKAIPGVIKTSDIALSWLWRVRF